MQRWHRIVHEVFMSGRRSHPRFAVASPWSGSIRILRDVVIDRTERDELLAVSNAAAVVGEVLSLDLIGGGQNVAIKVRVIDSRPVIIDGTVRHRVRLALPEAEPEERHTETTVTVRPAVQALNARVAEAG
jgi:hypothetical protein